VKFTIQSINELSALATQLLELSAPRKVFIFNGNLGAGKTTLIKELCKILNVEEETSSPTYSIVNEYSAPSGKVYHIDLYRLKSVEETYEIGLEDYLVSENYCFIEWPELAEELLPNHYAIVNIEKNDEENREIELILN